MNLRSLGEHCCSLSPAKQTLKRSGSRSGSGGGGRMVGRERMGSEGDEWKGPERRKARSVQGIMGKGKKTKKGEKKNRREEIGGKQIAHLQTMRYQEIRRRRRRSKKRMRRECHLHPPRPRPRQPSPGGTQYHPRPFPSHSLRPEEKSQTNHMANPL